MNPLFKAYNLLLNGLAFLSGVLIFSAFVMIVVDVTMRILGFDPPLFTVGTVEYILLWFTMLAAPWLTRRKGHVFIDAVTQFFPPLVKKAVAKMVYLICILSASVFCYFSAEIFWEAWTSGSVDVRGVDIPMWLLFVPMPLCFLLVAIEFARFLIGIDDMYSDQISQRESM